MASKIILTITSLSSTGEGVGTYQGMKVFVDGALPGETISGKLLEVKKNYALAQIDTILSTSGERVPPPCPLYGRCGGCQLMHVRYSAQLEFKRQRVEDALRRVGKLTDVEILPCLPSPQVLGYRNKIQLPLIWEKGGKKIGLYRKQSHEIIPAKECFIQCALGNEIFALIEEKLTLPSVRYVLIRNAIFRKEALIILVTDGTSSQQLRLFATTLMTSHPLIKGVVENVNTRGGNVILGTTYRPLAGRPFIYETLLGRTFKISPAAFFQVNAEQTERLYEIALNLAEMAPNETVVDAYCGVGTLAILAASQAKAVYGIESIAPAIANAKENGQLNHLSNCFFICGKAEETIEQCGDFETIFLNPPRKGCDSSLLYALLNKKPKKILYISCDPATLARDLAILKTSYKIDRVQPIDMFPQTMHVETVVRLTLEL